MAQLIYKTFWHYLSKKKKTCNTFITNFIQYIFILIFKTKKKSLLFNCVSSRFVDFTSIAWILVFYPLVGYLKKKRNVNVKSFYTMILIQHAAFEDKNLFIFSMQWRLKFVYLQNSSTTRLKTIFPQNYFCCGVLQIKS